MASDFTMYSGDTKSIAVTITDNDSAAVDLTGATSTWVITAPGSTTALVTKTSAAGEITYGGASTNVATIALDATDTDDLAGVYIHELEVTDQSGNVSTVCSGTVIISGDKT